MTIHDNNRDEKVQHNINRKHQKYWHYHESKTKKFEYFIDRSRVIEQTKFTYSFLGKVFEKQIKTGNHGEKQIKAINDKK